MRETWLALAGASMVVIVAANCIAAPVYRVKEATRPIALVADNNKPAQEGASVPESSRGGGSEGAVDTDSQAGTRGEKQKDDAASTSSSSTQTTGTGSSTAGSDKSNK